MKQTAKEPKDGPGRPVKFHTKILQAGKTITGIQIPDEVVEMLGAGKRPPIRVTINGQTYRSTVAVMGGQFMVGVSAENRAKIFEGNARKVYGRLNAYLDRRSRL